MTSPRLGAANCEHLLVGERDAQAVGELRDEDVIADLQRRNHRARRDLEGLDDEGPQQQRDRDGDADRFAVLAHGRLAREGQMFVHLGVQLRHRARASGRHRSRQRLRRPSRRRPRRRWSPLRGCGRCLRRRMRRASVVRLRAPRPRRAAQTLALFPALEISVSVRHLLDLQDGQEGFLRNLHVAHLLHALLAFLLALEQLALCGRCRRHNIWPSRSCAGP